jgi:hypothetical protein
MEHNYNKRSNCDTTSNYMRNFDPYSFVSRRVHSVGFNREMLETMVSFILDDVERLFGPRLEHPFGGICFASSHPQLE